MTVARLLSVLAVAVAAAAVAPAAVAAPSTLQTTFRTALLEDAKTTSAVKRALRSDAALVDPRPAFGDLTGDGRSDAVVSVTTGGAAGTIAVYVFSTDGAADGKLRAVFRSQQLYRATPAIQDDRTLLLSTPRYAAGDPLCCPAKLLERTYAWVAKDHVLRATGSREVDGPKPPAR
jgi:hypothetical protein